MSVHPLASFWAQFDLILCINLKERQDRRHDIQLVFDRMGIVAQFYTAERHPISGEIGCFESHQACMRTAYNAGCNNVLIFEDDGAELTAPTEHMMREIIRFIKTNTDWDLLFLGGYPSVFFETSKSVPSYTHIVKCPSQLTHSYAVSRKMMQKMLRITHSFFNASIDALYLVNKNSYVVQPTIFYQTDSPSNISAAPRGTAQIRKVIVQFKNKFSQYSPVPLYSVVIALFVILFLLLLLSLFSRRR